MKNHLIYLIAGNLLITRIYDRECLAGLFSPLAKNDHSFRYIYLKSDRFEFTCAKKLSKQKKAGKKPSPKKHFV